MSAYYLGTGCFSFARESLASFRCCALFYLKLPVHMLCDSCTMSHSSCGVYAECCCDCYRINHKKDYGLFIIGLWLVYYCIMACLFMDLWFVYSLIMFRWRPSLQWPLYVVFYINTQWKTCDMTIKDELRTLNL